jgi:hypothetical protein
LGFKRPADIRELITRNLGEFEALGIIRAVRKNTGKRGRPSIEYFLNEEQALLVSILSNTPNARAVRTMVIQVFVGYRRGQLTDAPPSELDERTNGIVRMLAKQVTRYRRLDISQPAP